MCLRTLCLLCMLCVIAGLAAQEQTPDKDQDGSIIKRRLAQLEYVLQPPAEESYFVHNKRIPVPSSKKHFVFAIEKGTKMEDAPLWKILGYDPRRPAGVIVSDDLEVCIAPRSYLEGKGVQDKLRKAAKAGKLPRMSPTWGARSDILAFDEVFASLKDAKQKDAVLAFAKRNGLRLVKAEGNVLHFQLQSVDLCAFASIFEASRALHMHEAVRWAEPAFVFDLMD